MSRQHHYYGLNHLHYLTASTYRRARLFDSERFRRHFVQTLDELSAGLGFKVLGYVLMPDCLRQARALSPVDLADRPRRPFPDHSEPEGTHAIFVLKNLRQNRQFPWCRRMLERLTLPPTVHLHGPYRVWQRRFYDLNVWSEKKRQEKLNTMHGNPVKRGLVTSPYQWPWSSYRYYFLEDASVLAMDRLP